MNYKDFLLRQEKPNLLTQEKIAACWCELEEKWNIKFTLKSGEFRPINEWLDDLYLKFSPEEINELMIDIMKCGDILFADILKHRE